MHGSESPGREKHADTGTQHSHRLRKKDDRLYFLPNQLAPGSYAVDRKETLTMAEKKAIGSGRSRYTVYWTAVSVQFTNTGTGYSSGTKLTVTHARSTQPLVIRVETTAEGGAIGTYAVLSPGSYAVQPQQDDTTRRLNGAGTGATLRVIWEQRQR